MYISQSVTSPPYIIPLPLYPPTQPPHCRLPSVTSPHQDVLKITSCATASLHSPYPCHRVPTLTPRKAYSPGASQHSPPPCCRVATPTRVATSCHNITFFTSTRARYLPPFADSILTSSPAPAPDTHLLSSAQDTYLLPCLLPHSSPSASPLVL